MDAKNAPKWGNSLSSTLANSSSSLILPNEIIIGTCTNLEKSYFRLGQAPPPETVRPEHILKRSHQHLQNQWKQKRAYAWICDQYKALRQDLTVQRIKNGFCVEVYETHARLALENVMLSLYS